jgi:hypothetical protein
MGVPALCVGSVMFQLVTSRPDPSRISARYEPQNRDGAHSGPKILTTFDRPKTLGMSANRQGTPPRARTTVVGGHHALDPGGWIGSGIPIQGFTAQRRRYLTECLRDIEELGTIPVQTPTKHSVIGAIQCRNTPEVRP